MRLWTLQPNEVAEKLLAGETFICDPKLSSFADDEAFNNAYEWLVERMELKTPKPENVTWPVWAWHTNYGAQMKPDRRRQMYSSYDQLDAILEIEIPDDEVILSDFDDWHCVLNNFAIMSDEEYENWEEKDKWDCPVYTDEYKLNSWEKVFRSDGEFVQACFWMIKPEHLVKVHKLRKRSQ